MSGGEVRVPPGFDEGGFGDVGEAAVCCQTMAKIMMKCLGEICDNVEADSINVEGYVKEVVGGDHGPHEGLRENI